MPKHMGRVHRRESLAAYLMLLPDVLGLIVFVVLPILFAIYVSLNSWSGLDQMKFIGLENYITLCSDSKFKHTIWVTLEYVVIYVPLALVIPLMIAVLIQAIPGKTQQVSRSLFYLPYTISTVVASMVCIFMFQVRRGYLNQIISALGFEKQAFLSSPQQAIICVAFVGVWMISGYNMIIYLSALKEIPLTYYEAAQLDGAGTLAQFFHITLPGLKDAAIYVAVFTTTTAFQVFDQIKVMTGGGPGNATNVTAYYIYQQAFDSYKLGYASALAVILALILIILTVLQMKMSGILKNEN